MLGAMYGENWDVKKEGIMKNLMLLGYWEKVTDELIEKLKNLDQLYSQMIGVVEDLWVDVNDDNIEKCSDSKLALELVMEVYKKHRRLVEVLDKG